MDVECPLKYILTYRLTQDPLELMFSLVRRKGGFNNNPTGPQMESAYKQILLNLDLEEVKTGNCFPQEAIPILDITNEPIKPPHDIPEKKRVLNLIRELAGEYTSCL